MHWTALLLALASVFVVPELSAARSIYSSECATVCADPDPSVDKPLPPDPRTFATAENGYTSTWVDCHDGVRPFQTCREWCAARDRGAELIPTFEIFSLFDATVYNDLWRAWGLSERPDDFDARITERYGLQRAPFANPYPLPGEMTEAEDPANMQGRSHPGGSGQLPMGMVQMHDEDGRHNGAISPSCVMCHAGRIGDETDVVGEDDEARTLGSWIGIGNTLFDIEVLSWDLPKAGGTPIPAPYSQSEARGTINADSAFEFLITARDFDTLDQTPFVKNFPAHAYVGDQDVPAWHNTGSRPRYFMDGAISGDDHRTFIANLLTRLNPSSSRDDSTPGSGAWIRGFEDEFEDIHAYIDSLEPPPFPERVKKSLARKGEKIFHAKNLFGDAAPPRGDGTCSGCHGIYSEKGSFQKRLPDYDHRARPRSRMRGIAGQIVPLATIGTDAARSNGAFAEARWVWGTTWFAYADNTAKDENPADRETNEILNDYVTSQSNGTPYYRESGPGRWIGVDDYGAIDTELTGYAAPPLHGVWATAPYFHNGSVPTVYGVLRPEARPARWRRLLVPGADVDRGFDASLAAYDFERLGWQYDELHCDAGPLVECADVQALLNIPGSQVWYLQQSPRPFTQDDVELRKIYDTSRYGRSNTGHPWTNSDTLDDEEVSALLEYLKTL